MGEPFYAEDEWAAIERTRPPIRWDEDRETIESIAKQVISGESRNLLQGFPAEKQNLEKFLKALSRFETALDEYVNAVGDKNFLESMFPHAADINPETNFRAMLAAARSRFTKRAALLSKNGGSNSKLANDFFLALLLNFWTSRGGQLKSAVDLNGKARGELIEFLASVTTPVYLKTVGKALTADQLRHYVRRAQNQKLAYVSSIAAIR